MAQDRPAAAASTASRGEAGRLCTSVKNDRATDRRAGDSAAADGSDPARAVPAACRCQPTPAAAPRPASRAESGQVVCIPATTPNAVKGVPPPPAAAVSSIRAVQGVQGIVAPRQLNLEAALLMKEGGNTTPAGAGAEGGRGKAAAAAAALLNGAKGPPRAAHSGGGWSRGPAGV
jgi:hypothetical protein